MSADEILSIKNLTVDYRRGEKDIRAVDGVSFAIHKDKLVSLVGESGCGKSTLGLSIIGLLPPRESTIKADSIRYKGAEISTLTEEQMRRYRGTEIAMIFQEPSTSLNPVYHVIDQIAEAIEIRNARTGRKMTKADFELVEKEARDFLRQVRVPDPDNVGSRYPFELSGGMSQRIMIAMALAEKPSLLVADEPTTSLDVISQAQILRLLRSLIKEVHASILLITHDLAISAQVADEVIVLYNGSIMESAETRDLFKEPLHPYTKGLISCVPHGSKSEFHLEPITGQPPGPGEAIRGCKFAPRCPFVMKKCTQNVPELAEVRPNHKVACFLYE